VSGIFFEEGFDSSSDRIVISGIDKACVKKRRRKVSAGRTNEKPYEVIGKKTDEIAEEEAC
jgi:hypothetical protein